MKRAAATAAIVLATVLAVLAFWQFRDVVVLFLLSLTVAATLRPVIDRLVARKVPTALAMLLVYVVVVGLLAGLVILISQPLTNEFQHAANDFQAAYERLKQTWPRASLVQQIIAAQLPATSQIIAQITGTQAAVFAGTVLGVTFGVFNGIGQIVLILVLTLYWSADQVHFERLWLSLLKAEDRVRARTTWRHVESGVGSYIRSELIQSLLALLVLSVAFTTMGVRYPVLLSIASAVLWFIPLVGGLLVVLVVLAVGFLSGPLVMVGAVAVTVAVLVALEYVVEPRLFNRKSYDPIIVIVFMIAMADAFGVLGLIVAPAIAVALQTFVTDLTSPVAVAAPGMPNVSRKPPAERPKPQVDDIRGRLATVRRMLSQMDEPPPHLVSMTERLEGLVKKLDPVAEQEQVT